MRAKSRWARRGMTAVVAGLLAFGASAAEAQIPAPRQARPIALTGGTIHTVTQGTIENGTIVFENGRITAIGRNVEIPPGAERVDITGKHVYPGLIDGYSALGLFEIGGFTQTIDLNELGPINPNVRAEVAFNPESRHIGVARSNGVLVTLSSPEGGLISGLAAAMMLDGWTWEEMALKRAAGLIVLWPNPANERRYESDLRTLREAFAAAKAYRKAQQAAERGGRRHDTDSRWEAMIPVIEGKVPVIVQANELRQIQDAITWAEEEGVRLVIRGGRDAWYVADHLREKQIPVLITNVLDSPDRQWEPYDGRYGLARRLHEAGVRFAIAGASSAAYENRLPYEAGAAAAYGLPAAEALKAVTLYPAQILGLDDRVGSLEPGKDATLLITTGDPLEYSTIIEQAYIQGRKLDMMDQHKEFFEKYMEKIRQARPRT